MNLKVVLYKRKGCELCKLMVQQFEQNPPNCDLSIATVRDYTDSDGLTKMSSEITKFPTIILFNGNTELARFEGFIDTDSLNKNIEYYESKSVL